MVVASRDRLQSFRPSKNQLFISTSQLKIFLYRRTIDGRWGMDRLFALVDSELHLDPRSRTLFVFFNRTRCLALDSSSESERADFSAAGFGDFLSSGTVR